MKPISPRLLATSWGCAMAIGLVLEARSAELVMNGGFETTTAGPGQLSFNTDAAGWTLANPGGGSSYTFLFASGGADTSGANGIYGNLQLWGPGNGSANGLPASSPNGGNYVAQDPAFQSSALQQTITGLTPGEKYTLSFYWGGAQQYGFTGPNYEGWQVSLGAQTLSTPVLNNSSHGFTGWQPQTFTYTASASSEVLSFLAVGGPNGVPPFAVLDGVSLQSVPDATSTAALFGVTSLTLGLVARWRRRA